MVCYLYPVLRIPPILCLYSSYVAYITSAGLEPVYVAYISSGQEPLCVAYITSCRGGGGVGHGIHFKSDHV